MRATHQVVNQPPALLGHDVLATDRALLAALHRHGGTPHAQHLHTLGSLAGSAEARQWGVQANAHPPVLRTHDRYGHRIDEVEFHPAWHELMHVAVRHGLHAAPWAAPHGSGAHVARAVGFLVWSQVEAGHGCPISMTYAAVPALRQDAALAAVWEPRLASTDYEFGLRAPQGKAGCIAGMAMTEKQGGSDVRANTTRAEPAGIDDGVFALTGHKWFCSAPMSDLFLVLAQAAQGLACFVVPRVLPDGTRNPFALQRLKDKLGNRSNASAEVEFDGTLGWQLGEAGRGVATILSMVSATRLDCVLGSSALLRAAVAEATWHAAHRRAFGALLVEQPAMTQVLADLALESEAATTLAIRIAATMDSADPIDAALRRAVLPGAKLWVTKRAEAAVGEAMECLGGNGYVEESGLPRLYREAPVNAIWEGAGNVQALDLLRVLRHEPGGLDAWAEEVALAAGEAPVLDKALAEVSTALRGVTGADAAVGAAAARRLAARMTTLLQAALLVRFAPAVVSDAFVATRVAEPDLGLFGLGAIEPAAARAIVARATPAV
jgi:putative acyl-CoA dehydrogenase